MPKIPTYTSTGTITTDTASVESNLQLNVNRTPASALAPVSKYLQESYIQEKTIEANNKSNLLLNNFYEDKKDDNGNVIQKGWLTIQSEAKGKDSPTEASEFYDTEIKKLYNWHKANDFAKLNNFEKKAIDRKFYATSGLLKTKVLSKARENLIVENQKIDEDAWSKDTLVLKELGVQYIETYKNNNKNRVDSNAAYDDGTKEEILKQYNENGITFLATNMANTQPNQFKKVREEGAFDDVSATKLLELDAVADGVIKDQKFQVLLAPLNIPFDSDPRDFVIANEEIKNKTFGGNENLQAIYQSLKPQEKIEFEKQYLTVANQMKSDRQLQILTSNNISKIESAQKTNEIFENFYINKGTYTEKLKKIFPDNQIAVEQFTLVNTKIGDGTANSISKFEKNDDIMKLIINDKINNVTDKFTLMGETTPLSILERVGKDVNIADVKFLNNLLLISNEENFKENHSKFFDFMNLFSLEISGSSALRDVDSKRDARLNMFKYTMYLRYIDGLKQGKTPDQLLKATRGNKDFIAYDIHTFIPSMDDVYLGIKEIIRDPDLPDLPFEKKTKKQLEDELGRKITIEEYDEEYEKLIKEN